MYMEGMAHAKGSVLRLPRAERPRREHDTGSKRGLTQIKDT